MLSRKIPRHIAGSGLVARRLVVWACIALGWGGGGALGWGGGALGWGIWTCTPVTAAEFEAEKFFESEVRPLLVRECFECHGAKKQESGLRLDSRASLLRGGDSGAAVVPGQADQSLLLSVLSYEADIQMPPRGKLAAGQIAVLRRWIEGGAVWPGGAASSVRGPEAISDAVRRHWSFQPLGRYAPPDVQDAAWPRNEIDRFLRARQESAGVRPVADADRRTLIRRATQDLLGLPPTAAEVARFLDDSDPDAYPRLIDRLLASPHYGERWGRHWLDLARYADTAGDGADYPIREAYKYRNYVIQALNHDKPYDQFVREQIAGDILAAEAAAAGAISRDRYAELVIATGYLAVTKRFGYNVNTEFQHLDIADTLDTLGRSLLGLSIGCARCHDHKYDPVTAADYYALYGIFASTQYSFPGGEEHKRPHHLVPLALPAEVAALQARQQQQVKLLDEQLEKVAEADLEVAYGVSEATPVNARIQRRGEPDRLGEEVPRRFLEILGGQSLPPDTSGSGRRELAHWLTSPDNPLTARVLVNRVWQQHFGQGLVATPSDFGTRGQPPSHPELLDWLTSTWISEGWSLKQLHRRIMLSRTYQLASSDDSRNLDLDPWNQLYWRQTRRPLAAEEIRDAVLAVGGGLDRTPGGPHPFPPVDQWSFTIHYPFHAVYESNRRSVYLMIQRARRHPFLALFDAADPNISTAQRQPTITPTQALYLTNSSLVHEQSDHLAQRVLAEVNESEQRVQRLFLWTLARSPETDELADALSFVAQYRERSGQVLPAEMVDRAAWAALARVIMTSNEFIYVD